MRPLFALLLVGLLAVGRPPGETVGDADAVGVSHAIPIIEFEKRARRVLADFTLPDGTRIHVHYGSWGEFGAMAAGGASTAPSMTREATS